MTREELDTLWFQAMRQSIEEGEDFIRYHFAALVAAEKEQQMLRDGWRQCAKWQRTTQYCGLLDAAVRAEREACAKACEARYMGDNNREDLEARRCAAAIRARQEVKP